MFGSKTKALVLAVIFGVLATVFAGVYISSARAKMEAGYELTPALRAAAELPAGTPASALGGNGRLVEESVPSKFLPADALSDLTTVSDQVLATPVSEGGFLTASSFKSKTEAAMSLRLPEGQLAVGVPIDVGRGVAGELRSGDRVGVFVTLAPGPDGQDITKRLLSGIEVLTATFGGDEGVASQAAGARGTVTLAVTADQAEKLIFGQEKGTVWLGLESVAPGQSSTPGRTLNNVFE